VFLEGESGRLLARTACNALVTRCAEARRDGFDSPAITEVFEMKKSLWLGIGLLGVAALGAVLAQGMMGGYGMGMMSGMNLAVYAPSAKPISDAKAMTQLEAFATRYGADARVKDVMVFGQNVYAQIVDAKGAGLGELLVDRYSGVVQPEPGPNMMWNSRFGMGWGGTGMMNPNSRQTVATVRYSQTAAQGLATTFLSGFLPGAKVQGGQAFPGYYTFDFGRTEIDGMLSVNALTGEVWVHTWHGPFITELGMR
jgi:hypothetical protein